MTATSRDKTHTAPALPVDTAENMHAWQQATGRKPDSAENPSRPVRAKVTHGIFANRIFGAEEYAQFHVMIETLREETMYNGAGDLISLELLCIYCLKIVRALHAEEYAAVRTLDQMIRQHLDCLKMTRKQRLPEGDTEEEMSPLAFAMALVEQARQRQAEQAAQAAAAGETPESARGMLGDGPEATPDGAPVVGRDSGECGLPDTTAGPPSGDGRP